MFCFNQPQNIYLISILSLFKDLGIPASVISARLPRLLLTTTTDLEDIRTGTSPRAVQKQSFALMIDVSCTGQRANRTQHRNLPIQNQDCGKYLCTRCEHTTIVQPVPCPPHPKLGPPTSASIVSRRAVVGLLAIPLE